MDMLERRDVEPGALGPPGPRLAATGLTVVVGVVVAWIAGIAVPYAVNDLHHLPLADLGAGAHDPKDLWPANAGPGWQFLGIIGALGVTVGALALPCLAVLFGGALALHGHAMDALTRRLVQSSLAITLVTLMVWVSPWGQALSAWSLD
jgi:hypothetical protein